jgi:hypothetical protein
MSDGSDGVPTLDSPEVIGVGCTESPHDATETVDEPNAKEITRYEHREETQHDRDTG